MVSQHSPHDDDVMGKAFDLRLMRRLLHFLTPYWRIFSVCVLLILVLTGIQTVLPYITKIAIDDFLTLPWAVVTLDQSPSAGEPIALGDGRYLVQTGKVSPDLRTEWESSGALSAKRYLFVAQGSPQETVVARYPQVFTPVSGGFYASDDALRALPAADTITLRQRAIAGVIKLAILFAMALVIRFMFGVAQVYLLQLTGQKVMYDMRRGTTRHACDERCCRDQRDVYIHARQPVSGRVPDLCSDGDHVPPGVASGARDSCPLPLHCPRGIRVSSAGAFRLSRGTAANRSPQCKSAGVDLGDADHPDIRTRD